MTTFEMIEWLKRELTIARNHERQETAQKILDYYGGLHLDYLRAIMDEQFSDAEKMKLQLRVENLVELVGDAISRVFDQQPKLQSADQKVQDFLANLDPLLPLLLKKAEVYKNLTRICGVHSWWDDEAQTIKHTLLPSSVLFVEEDERDANKAITVVYTRTLLDTIGCPKIEYIHWDADNSFIWSKEDPAPRPFDMETNPDMLNPYGIIPIVFIRDDVATANFFDDIDETLMNAQEALNVELTTKAFNVKMQGFSQPVLTGWDGKSPIQVDPSKPICIPAAIQGEGQGKFEFVIPDAKIAEIQGSIDAIKSGVFERYGIKTDAVRSSASGYALKLMDSKLNRRREDDLALSLQFLHDLIEVDRVIWNTHNPTNQVAPGKTTADFAAMYEVDFVEPTYDEDPEKTQKIDKEDIAMGIITAADRLMKLNPDIELEEADKKIAENMAKASAWLGERKKFGLADLINKTAAPGTPTPGGNPGGA